MQTLFKTSIAITLSFNFALSSDITLNLKDGWNLIANPTSASLSSDYFGSETLWIYDGNWQKNPATISKGQGIWIKSNEKSLTLSDESYKQDFLNTKSGWNLLGTGEEISVPDSVKRVLTYDGSWHNNPSTIKAGEGFWANVTNSISNFDFSPYISKSTSSTATVTTAQNANSDHHEESSDYNYDNTNIINITLNQNSISLDNSSVALVNESNITIKSAGVYRVSGTLNDGEIIVDSSDEEPITLILDSVDITSTKSAPINIQSAKKTIINLADGTINYLKDSESNSENGTLFSRDNLSIYGGGTLSVTSNSNDGIRSNDGLIIESGVINITSSDDGIRGKDYLVIKGGDITITSSGDGLKSDNENSDKGYILIENGNFDITSGGDTIKGESDILIKDGTFNLNSGEGSSKSISSDLSAKGLKAGVKIVIDGGEFNIDSADDTIHSNDSIAINSGTFKLLTGDDGIHADTAIEINGGEFNIEKSYEGIESAVITINNGYIQITSSDDGLNVAGGNSGTTTNPMDFNGGDFNMTKPNDNMMGGDFNMSTPNEPQGGFDNNESFAISMNRPAPDNFTAPHADNFTNLGLSGDYHLNINGGYIVIDSKGDGLDANGYINMSGGVVIVNGPIENMNGPIDYDGSFEITGGTLIAVGSSGMAQAPSSSSSQNSLLVRFNSWQSEKTLVNVQSASGESLVTFASTKEYQSFVFSSPSLVTGESYNLYLGGSINSNKTHGLYESGEYSGGNLYSDFTISSSVTTIK